MKKITLKEALRRIEALEAELAALKARPSQEFHYHYYYQQSQPTYIPALPQSPIIWCVSADNGTAKS